MGSMIYVSDILGVCDESTNTSINSYLVISMSSFMIIAQLILLPIFSIFIADIYLILIAIIPFIIAYSLSIALYFLPTSFIAILLYGFHGMSFSIIPILGGALSK